MQESKDFCGQEQQEQGDKTEDTLAVSKLLLERSQRGRSRTLGRLGNLVTLCAFVQYLAIVAACGVQRDDAIGCYVVSVAGIIIHVATALVLRVVDSVQWRWKSFRDRVRGPLEKFPYMIWIAFVLLAIPMTLAPVFNDVNLFKAADSIGPEM